MAELYDSFHADTIALALLGIPVLLHPMDHTEFLKHLPAERTSQLSQRSDRAGLLHLAGHVSLIGLTGGAIALGLPGWQLLLLPHGIFVVFLFTLVHEATHQTPFASRRLNEIVGHTAGIINLLPFQWFRYFHFAHHRYTNDPAKDPELLDGAKPTTWNAYLKHVSGLPTWISLAQGLIRNARNQCVDDFVPTRAKQRITFEARAYLALYALAALSLTQSAFLFWVWLLPMVLGQPVLRLYLLAEHAHCAHVADMLANTRTTYTTRFIRFIAWNMPYHIEHHTMPNVPFHHLPMLHMDMKAALKETANGYQEFTADFTKTLRSTTTPK